MKLKYFILIFLLTACGGLSDAGKALRNEKVRSTDEFLIEKRGPLTLPPNMNELPKPKSKSFQNKNSDKKISSTKKKNKIKFRESNITRDTKKLTLVNEKYKI